jgi:hypothetical protein
MYNNKLAACIKVGGKVLRENKDEVYIPFGSSYAISVKNLNSVRASVRITIDGVDVLDGNDLVINPNQTIDINRSIKDGNLNSGNAFKFIERTGKIEDHRGIKIDDGLIRIEYAFEVPKPVVIEEHVYRRRIHHDWPYYWPYGITNKSSSIPPYSNRLTRSYADVDNMAYGQSTSSFQDIGANTQIGTNGGNAVRCNYSANSIPTRSEAAAPEVGITVPGEVISQSFSMVDRFKTEDVTHSMVFRLLGVRGEEPVKKAITVKDTVKCDTCGTKNKAHAKFCTECGTSLI